MSRWSEEFENHPIHQLLNQTFEFLEVDVKDTNAAFEDERRRLIKVLGNLREIIEGLDHEFFPKQLLDQINTHLSHQSFLQQLQTYSSNPTQSQLQTANNHITNFAPQIFQLAAMSRPMESQKLITNAEKAFGSFTTSMETKAKVAAENFQKLDAELVATNDTAGVLKQQIDALDVSVNEKLAEWQTDFTEKQTTRIQEHSDSQIERDTKFEELLSEWKVTVEEQRASITQTQTDKLQATLNHFKETGEAVLKDVNQRHEEVKEIHKLVGRDSVAGGYQTSAGEEKSEANRWRWISLACLAAAIIWLTIKYWYGFELSKGGELNWPEIVTASSLTAVFLIAAGYTSRQSKLHRDNEKQLRSYALETKALDPFIASLPLEEQQKIKAELVRRMFGQQNASSSGKPSKVDDGTIKTILDKMPDIVTDAVGKLIKKD